MKRGCITILVVFLIVSTNMSMIYCNLEKSKLECTPSVSVSHDKAFKKTSTWDFFKDTSKNNQNMAEKALAVFVGGIICFIISIYLTCWNERRAVKEVEFTDFISKESKCISVGNGVKVDKVDQDMSYIVSGSLELDKQAEIPNLDLEFKYGGGRMFIIKYEVEKYSIHTYTNSENETKTVKEWIYNYESNVDEKYKSRTITGEGSINGVYKVNLEKLSHLVDRNQTKSLADNKYKHIFTSNDLDAVTKYFKTDSPCEIKVFLKDDYVYVIRKDADKLTDFSEKDYNFSEDDRRISIKYFYAAPAFQVTAVGQLDPIAGDKYNVIPKKTTLKKAGFHWLCCCCADSDDYYEVDLLYDGAWNRSEIVERLKNENDFATALFRILGFLLHFAGYYGLLYPLIMLIGMIPFIGAVGATVLIFIAFFLAVISFLFLIACAWIFARPWLALLLFTVIAILIVLGNQAEKAMKENGWIKDENSNNNGNGNSSRLNVQHKTHNGGQSNSFLR